MSSTGTDFVGRWLHIRNPESLREAPSWAEQMIQDSRKVPVDPPLQPCPDYDLAGVIENAAAYIYPKYDKKLVLSGFPRYRDSVIETTDGSPYPLIRHNFDLHISPNVESKCLPLTFCQRASQQDLRVLGPNGDSPQVIATEIHNQPVVLAAYLESRGSWLGLDGGFIFFGGKDWIVYQPLREISAKALAAKP